MRFWKFIKDELRKNQNQQDLQNNDSLEVQEISDSNSQQGDNQNQQDSNNSQNDQLNDEKNNSTDSNNNESNASEDQEISDSNSQQSEEKDMSDSQSQQGDNQEQQSQSHSNGSEQSQKSSQQTSDSQQSEEKDMSGSQSQQGDSQEQSNQPQNNSSEQSQESSQQSSDSQQSEEEQLNNNSSQEQDCGTNDSVSYSDEIEDIQEEVEQTSDEIVNNPKLTNEQKRELLEKLKKSLQEIKKRKAEKLQREQINHEKQEIEESKEEKYELSEQTNNFLNQLGELPSFEDRDRDAGYSIDTDAYTEVPESIIRTLITKFLNQRFCKHITDLNIRSNSLEKTNGFYKWEVKDVITHLQTHQVTKVLTDKYGYEYANGKNENVPLSFYFDMSGSMSEYTNLLSIIAIELLKKNVKVLIGFNERVNVQIESISKSITVQELADILKRAGYSNWGWSPIRESFKKDSCKDSRVSFKFVDKNIDNYLLSKKAEKCVVFSDFDPRSEVINLSQAADVYWFCFESRYDSYDLDDFNGFIYKVQNIRDLEQGLLKVNEKRFETLCYTDNPKSLQKKVRVKR